MDEHLRHPPAMLDYGHVEMGTDAEPGERRRTVGGTGIRGDVCIRHRLPAEQLAHICPVMVKAVNAGHVRKAGGAPVALHGDGPPGCAERAETDPSRAQRLAQELGRGERQIGGVRHVAQALVEPEQRFAAVVGADMLRHVAPEQRQPVIGGASPEVEPSVATIRLRIAMMKRDGRAPGHGALQRPAELALLRAGPCFPMRPADNLAAVVAGGQESAREKALADGAVGRP